MKIFIFILLIALTACTQNTSKQESENLTLRDNPLSNYLNPPDNDEDLSYEYIDHDDSAEPEAIPISEYKISLYLTNINPYRKEYERFFEEQLKIYGRDSNGELLINLQQSRDLNIKNGFFLSADPEKNYEITHIEIIEHGKTTLYPVEGQ